MTVDAYINPDFGWSQKLIFLLVTLSGVLICILMIIAGVAVSTSMMKADSHTKKKDFYERAHNRVQRFYEMIISGTSVLSFSCAYVVINHIYAKAQDMGDVTGSPGLDSFLSLWADWKDFILLLLICLSCFLNSLLDRLVIPLKKTDRSEKACVRMLAMFYCIIILIHLNNIGDESEYNPVMIYYFGLMVGRFVYFDASFRDFLQALRNMFKNIYLLILGLALTGLLCLFGFGMEYLLEKNYYIVGAFYTHLFMLVAVFILHHSHILSLFVRKPKDEPEEEYADGYEEDDYDEEEFSDEEIQDL
ncbi:MAG: hypothetical protein K5686_03605 [Lachnospiraceae bacterium]|nr:hypothetical protein [Lachnospiraceae bacterium]